MRAVNPKPFELPGFVVRQVDANLILSNIVTILCTGNQRAARISALDSDALGELATSACDSESQWLGGDISLKAKESRARMDALAAKIMPLAIALGRETLLVDDIGAHMRSHLGGVAGGWETTWVSSPTMGFARPYSQLHVESGLASGEGTVTTSIGSVYNNVIANTLMNLDVTRFVPELIPAPQAFANQEPRDQPWGPTYSMMQQIKRVRALATLYVVQGSLIHPILEYRRNMVAWELAYKMEQRSRAALTYWKEAYDYVLQLPLHPILTLLKSASANGTVNTYHGKKDLLLRTCDRSESKVGTDASSCPTELMDYVLDAAGRDYARMNEPGCWGRDSDGAEQPGAGQASGSKISIGRLARLIRSLGDVTELWEPTSRLLGWGSLSAEIGELNQAGADFALTDGISFSEPVGGLIFGLRPVLSSGNSALSGFERRFDDTFNTKEGAVLEWSSVPVEGYQGSTTGAAMYGRSYIPAGMWMGEPDVEQRYGRAIGSDVFGKEVLRFWAEHSAYVEQGYGPALPIEGVPGSDWDFFAVAQNQLAADRMLLDAYAGQIASAANSHYYYKEKFYHRVPVAMTVIGGYEFYNELGRFMNVLDQDGHIAFDGEVTMRATGAQLQAIVDSAHVGQAAHMREQPSPERDEVIVPS